MSRFFKIFIFVVIIAAVAGFLFWQQNKKKIVKDSIQNTIAKKSDSLYYLHYDSSVIDEVNGNVSFFKITLQSDTVQKQLLKNIDSLPHSIFNVKVAEVTANGIDIPGLLQNQHVKARSIVLKKPVIQITNTGAGRPKSFTLNDTLELYQKLLGKFKRIQADEITIVEGTILITDKKGKSLTTIENINISLKNFLIDSTRDYQNLISYFIKDVKVTVANIQLPPAKNGTRINMSDVIYDAPQKILSINTIAQYHAGNTTPLIDLKNIKINQLNTDAFIINQQLKAGLLACDGGLITIYKKQKIKQSGKSIIELSAEFFDEVFIGGINLNKTKIMVLNAANLKEPPLIINKVEFKTLNVLSVTDGNTIKELIGNAEWQLKVGEFSFVTKQKLSKFSARGLVLNNQLKSISAKVISLKPLISDAEFIRISKFQKDKYDIAFNNIELKNVDFKKLIADNVLEIESATLQLILKIYNDRTLPADTISKVGKFPNQSLVKIPFQFYAQKIVVNNGAVFYKEKSKQTEMSGIPNFTDINAVISNVTNIPSKIKTDGQLKLNASALFLNAGKLKTNWVLPLNAKDTIFSVTGNIGKMDASILNQIIEPLGMVSIKSGTINKVDFEVKGNNYKGGGKVTFLYNDLKLEVLKMKNDVLKKRLLITILANTLIKNNNPIQDDIYVGKIDFNRNVNKSFFDLVWKSILSGIKNTVLRK